MPLLATVSEHKREKHPCREDIFNLAHTCQFWLPWGIFSKGKKQKTKQETAHLQSENIKVHNCVVNCRHKYLVRKKRRAKINSPLEYFVEKWILYGSMLPPGNYLSFIKYKIELDANGCWCPPVTGLHYLNNFIRWTDGRTNGCTQNIFTQISAFSRSPVIQKLPQ